MRKNTGVGQNNCYNADFTLSELEHKEWPQ